jgi:LPXTG-site transpeptidase (sortase) family protein
MRNFGSVLILVLIGITILVVSIRNDRVLVSHAQISNEVQSEGQVIRARSTFFRESSRKTKDTAADSVLQIEPEPPVDPVKPSPPKESKVSRIDPQNESSVEAKAEKVYERLIIPKLKVFGKVRSIPYAELSWDLTTLGQDIAFLQDVPGQTTGNNLILAAHITVRNGSNGPFRYLWKIDPGDKIILQDDQQISTYIVREQLLVYPEDISVLADTSHPQLTLITCHTWDEETLSYLRRLVVFADLEGIEARQTLVE